jgi:hypothetical protein
MFKSSIFTLFFFSFIQACSFTGSDGPRKSESYSLNFNEPNWESIGARNADSAFMSKETQSILIINSLCDVYEATSLNHLISNMIGGIENIVIQNEEEKKLANRKSLRTYATGEIDGFPISLMIETVRKDDCIYDFALISSSREIRSKDEQAFNHLLAGVNIP